MSRFQLITSTPNVVSKQKKARYKDIQKWIRDNYDEHVTNLDIANTKRKFGLIQDNHTGIDEYQISIDLKREKIR